MLTNVSDVVGIRVDSPVGTLDHSAVFIDFVLVQPIPHLGVGRRSIARTLWTGSLEEM